MVLAVEFFCVLWVLILACVLDELELRCERLELVLELELELELVLELELELPDLPTAMLEHPFVTFISE